MAPEKPSLALLRSLTDDHVLRALMDDGRATRAQLASRTGLSKPTVSGSVRRLLDAGLLQDTGERTTGRGRVGLYYALADDVGTALAVSMIPGQVVAEIVDADGQILRRVTEALSRPARPEQANEALHKAAQRAAAGTATVRLAVVSAADPVDRVSGRLVHLPDARFLLGDLDPAQVLRDVVAGPVTVDNDVNWAAQTERDARAGSGADDFVYLYLGEGLGAAVISDGEVRRGHNGFAGEVSHVLTTGPGGAVLAFTEVFRSLDLCSAGSTAIDVERLLALVSDDDTTGRHALDALGRAVIGVVAAAIALLDPALVVIGGPWGSDSTILQAIGRHVGQLPRPVAIEAARRLDDPALTGARNQAQADLRRAITNQNTIIRSVQGPTP